MPRPQISNSGPPLTESRIARLEATLNHALPDDYRAFLLEHNGGRPSPESFGREGSLHSILSVFFGLGLRKKFYDLKIRYRESRDDMPAEVLPIGLDLGGDMICLAFKGKRRGLVYLWEHEGGTEQLDWEAILPGLKLKPYAEDEPRSSIKGDWPGHPDMILIADSFTEFLESFHDQPELDDEPEPEPEPPEPEDDDEPEDEPPGPPPEPAVWPLPGKPRKATKAKTSKAKGGSKASKAKGGSKVTKAKPRAKKATKARSRDKG